MSAEPGRRRLAVFLPSLAGGGAERTMVSLIGAIVERDLDVDLVLSAAEGPYLPDVPPRVRVVDLGASRVITSAPALIRYLRRERPDALLTVLSHASLVGLVSRALARVPTRVAVLEQDTFSEVARETHRRRARLVPALARLLYPRADAVVAVSTGVADDLADVLGIARKRVSVVYNPVVRPEMAEAARRPAPHPWLADGEPPVVIGIGRLQPRKKDFAALIRAFADARGETGARLMILGEGPERDNLEALVADLGIREHVALPGFVENPHAFLSRAALFVLSSQWEGLPTVLIEALFCGAPVVSTDCPSGPSEILADGEHGVLVPVGDQAALASGIVDGLAGRIPKPEPESWKPYELSTIADRYVAVLFDDNGRSVGS
ncbi:MAG: glycosyltransferase [Acidimicrobiales bacterium]